MTTARLPLAVTMGEPAGIGGELSLKAWLARDKTRPFFAIDDPARLAALASTLGLAVPVREITAPHDAASAFATALPVLSVKLEVPARHGQPDPANAPATLAAIERAVQMAQAGTIAGFATNPIQKKTLQDAGFRHPGHTEFLAELAGGAEVAMMLACPALRVVPVTIHLSLADAVHALQPAVIVRAGRIAAAGLESLFGIARPRLAVAALNPHAGEQGLFGDEEQRILAPAVRTLGAEGPFPADTVFVRAQRGEFDAVLAPYHDVGMTAIKVASFGRAVNVTLGLPFVRTSPDHGTAFDIAGKGTANPSSLLAALTLAARLSATAPALVPAK